MATSIVSIYNLALQKLGAARVGSISEDSPNTRSCNACYEHLRDTELRTRPWVFSIKRASLAASATVPLALLDTNFPDANAYPLPVDSLRPLFPPRTYIDWVVENIDGSPAIISNDSAPLLIRYISQVVDPAKFDINFVEMLAARMAVQMSEEITQSNTKLENINKDYERARATARKMNAYESVPNTGPEDSWLASRRAGSVLAPWLSRQNG